MTYECEFHGGHISPVAYIRDCGLFKSGLAKDARGYRGRIPPDVGAIYSTSGG